MLATISLKFKLILIPFLCLLPITLVLGVLFYKQDQHVIESKALSTLKIAALEVSLELEKHLSERALELRLLANHPYLYEAIEERRFDHSIGDMLAHIGVDIQTDRVFLLDQAFSMASTAAVNEAFLRRLREKLALLSVSLDDNVGGAYFMAADAGQQSEEALLVMTPIAPSESVLAWLALSIDFEGIVSTVIDRAVNKREGNSTSEFKYAITIGDMQSDSTSGLQREDANASVLSTSHPVAWRGLHFIVHVRAERALVDDHASPDRGLVYLLLLASIVIQVLSLAWSSQNFLLKRIRQMVETAKAFSAGDYTARVNVTGCDELYDLATEFNSMCADVSQANLYLKKMIEVRTLQAEESQGRLEAILRSVGDAIVSIDAAGNIVSFNLAAENIFGYKEPELLGHSVELLMPVDQAIVHQRYLDAAKEKGDLIFSIRGGKRVLEGRRKDGARFPIEITVTKGESNGNLFFIGAIEDLSEKKETQRRLNKQQQMLSIALENSTEALVIANQNGSFIKANNAICQWLDYEREEILSMNLLDITSERHYTSTQTLLSKLANGELNATTKEYQYIRKNGSLVWGLLSMSAIKNDDNVVDMLVAQIVDIDEVKEMAVSLKERNSELEKTNYDLDQFAYIASHDLKSPLNAIKKIACWIEEDAKDSLSDDVKKNVALIKNRSERMMKLLDDLLFYSRVGRIDERLENIELAKMVDELVDVIDKPDSFSVGVDVDGGALRVPRVPFELVLRNLISNAIKHHDKSQGRIQIQLVTKSDYYVIRVKDDGPGIPESMQEKVFEMFQTLKPRDKVEGSGMGLALVKKTVERFGARVFLESDGEHGAAFVVHWPKK